MHVRVIGGAEDATSGVGPVEGTTEAGVMISVGISACCACCGYLSCGNSGCVGLARAPRGAT